MNAISIIAPYKYEGVWVFDDPRVGLSREPFVSGADVMMDKLVSKVPSAEKGFRLLFSAKPFPGYTVKLEWRREEYGGNWYYSPQFDMEGWLCPALFKYDVAFTPQQQDVLRARLTNKVVGSGGIPAPPL